MSNKLDPDQARRIVGPDLGPNCLQRFSADGTGRQRVKIAEWRERVTHTIRFSHYDKMISFYCKILIAINSYFGSNFLNFSTT